MKKPRPSFIYPLLWIATCTVLLVLPGKAFPKENWLEKIWFDKWVHIGLFAILVFLCCWAIQPYRTEPGQRLRVFILVALLSLGYGTGMEYVQKYFVANRSFDTGDILADGVGCLAGFFYSFRSYIKK